MRKIPILKTDLYLIVEGYADSITISRITKELVLKYNVKIVESLGFDNIVNRYLNYASKYPYSKILIFCDLDNKKTVKDIRKLFTDKDVNIDINTIYFVNPMIEFLWFISRKRQAVKYTKKKDFAKFIEREFGVLEYKGSKIQVDKIIKQLNSNDIRNMFVNIKMIISSNDLDLPATNILKLTQLLEEKDL